MIIFRADASPQIGFGHLTRCRALAMALRRDGKRCVMVGPDSAYAKRGDDAVFDEWVPVSEWPSSQEDALQTIKIAQRHQADWLVLDDYRIDEAYQLAIRAAGLRWLQFDGTASKPLWADIVLNANPAARSEDYQAVLRNSNARLLLGPRYAILRPEFDQVTPREPGRPVKKILLTFGGGDDRGANQFVLSTLLPVTSPEQEFVVISGATNPSNPSLKQWLDTHGQGRVSLHIDPDKLAPLFASCDLAFMAGGTSTYEAACCGLPMIIVAIADNQWWQSEGWVKQGVAAYAGPIESIDNAWLHAAFSEVAEPAGRRLISIRALELVDGKGVGRVADEVIAAQSQ